MTALILLTSHSGGLDYNLDQNSNFSSIYDNVLMCTASPANLFGKIWIAKVRPAYCKNFALTWVQQLIKKKRGGVEIKAAKTTPSRQTVNARPSGP
jgi:hypothetical protein